MYPIYDMDKKSSCNRSAPPMQPAPLVPPVAAPGIQRPSSLPRHHVPQVPLVAAPVYKRPLITFLSGLQWDDDVTKRMIMPWKDAEPFVNNSDFKYDTIRRFDTSPKGEAWVKEFQGVPPPNRGNNAPPSLPN